MSAVLCLAPGLAARDGEEWIDPETIDWKALRGKPLRIIYSKESQMRRYLRAACASDCIIDLLDADQVDYAIVTYDDSRHRAFKKAHEMAICEPMLSHMPPIYALTLLKEYQREGSKPRRSRSLGAASSGRHETDALDGPHRSDRRSNQARTDRGDAALAHGV